jgi:uncharacterized membrane protein
VTDDQTQNPQATQPVKPKKKHRIWSAIGALTRTRIVTGLLIIIPILVTWKVAEFVFNVMKSASEPIAWKIARELQEGQQIAPELPLEGKMEREIISEALTRMINENPDLAVDPQYQQAIIDRMARKLTRALQNVPDAPVGLIDETYLNWIVPAAAVLLTLFLLYFVGFFGASVFGRRIIRLIDGIFEKLPLVKVIYKATKQIVMTLGGSQQMNFRRVVLVQFPHTGMKCIGFLTAVMKDVDTGRDMASIFISTTPNPTTGYMQIVPLQDVSETNWSVEDAVKLLMSGGILSPPMVPFDKVHPVKVGPELRAKGNEISLEDIQEK